MWVFKVNAHVSLNNTPLGCIYRVEREVGGGGQEGLEETERHTSSWRVDFVFVFYCFSLFRFPKETPRLQH